jgi:hypothetical protein
MFEFEETKCRLNQNAGTVVEPTATNIRIVGQQFNHAKPSVEH